MKMLSRRHLIEGAAYLAVAALPAGAHAAAMPGGDATLAALLETLGAIVRVDETPAGAAAFRATWVERLASLKRFDARSLSAQGRIEYDATLAGLSAYCVLAERFPIGALSVPASPYVVSQRSGTYIRLAESLAYGGRELGLGGRREIDGETERIKADAAIGIVPPDFILDRVCLKITAFMEQIRHASAFDQDLGAAAQRQLDTLNALRANAGHDGGVWRFKGGDEYYALALKGGTSLDLPPAEVHRGGLELAKELSARANALLKAQGLSQGSVGVRLHSLAQLEPYLYPDTDAGRAQALAEMNAELRRVVPMLPSAFAGLTPDAVTVKLAPPGRAGYREAPSVDGSKSGVYYVDLRDIRRRPVWSLPTVVHHEMLPGHLLQMPLQEAAKLHALRLALTPPAYFEGWAIYGEGLAREFGLFDGNPLGELGYLQSVLVRLGRQIVDTGLHHLRWSRERAMAEFAAICGDAPESFDIEVDRMCVQPGLMPGHALGCETILKLRDKARRALGPRFNLTGFHSAILKRGALPLSVLGEAVGLWIAEAESRPG